MEKFKKFLGPLSLLILVLVLAVVLVRRQREGERIQQVKIELTQDCRVQRNRLNELFQFLKIVSLNELSLKTGNKKTAFENVGFGGIVLPNPFFKKPDQVTENPETCAFVFHEKNQGLSSIVVSIFPNDLRDPRNASWNPMNVDGKFSQLMTKILRSSDADLAMNCDAEAEEKNRMETAAATLATRFFQPGADMKAVLEPGIPESLLILGNKSFGAGIASRFSAQFLFPVNEGKLIVQYVLGTSDSRLRDEMVQALIKGESAAGKATDFKRCVSQMIGADAQK